VSTYTPDALGRVVQTRRIDRGLSQEALGRAAGYAGGAAVSISRLENGKLTPTPERLSGIAGALGMTSDALLELAATQTRAGSARTDQSLEDRIAEIRRQSEMSRRVIAALDEFAEASRASNTAFLLPLRDRSAQLDGIDPPPLSPADLASENPTGSDATTRLLITRYGLARALRDPSSGSGTDAAFRGLLETTARVAAALDGPESGLMRGAAGIGGLGVALGLARPALGRTALPAAIAAGTAVVTLGGILLGMARRNRAQQQRLAAEVAEVELQIDETRAGVEALLDLVPRATEILRYIEVHAAHALNRWAERIGSESVGWRTLDEAQRTQYDRFVEIGAAQVQIETLDFSALLDGGDAERPQRIGFADDILRTSRDLVRSYV
jgi:transcriptional regulator with XRE-family HTH domain